MDHKYSNKNTCTPDKITFSLRYTILIHERTTGILLFTDVAVGECACLFTSCSQHRGSKVKGKYLKTREMQRSLTNLNF